jgi:predicted exporter
VGLVPLRGVRDDDRLRQAVSGPGAEQSTYVDLRRETSRLLGGYRQEALHLLGWSSLAIVLLLVVGLRSLRTAMRVLLPMASAAAVTAAVMAGTGSGLSLFHLVSLLLVMGLSLDQALFFNRAAEDHQERARTLLSLVLCNLSAVLAFGILATSSVNILHDIGATVALGAGLALVFAALLAGEVLPREDGA